MYSVQSAPDFVLWTGDAIHHATSTQESVLSALNVTTALLRSAFPNTRILPVIGK